MPIKLILEAFALNDQPLSQPLHASFDDEGGTIGRADQNTLTLPDPERHISRHQALVSGHAAGFSIRNIGSANPITVGGQPLACDATAPLADGDQIRIGGYMLRAVARDADDCGSRQSAQSAQTAQTTSIDSGATTPDTVPSKLIAPGDLLSNPVLPLIDASWDRPAIHWPESDRPPPSGTTLPDDFDPFAPAQAGKSFESGRPTFKADSAFADLVPEAPKATLDELFGLTGPLDNLLANFTRGDAPAEDLAGMQGSQLNERVSSLRSAFHPPGMVDVGIDHSAVPAWWAAFCEGASIPIDSVPAPQPEQMRHAGAALREAINGLSRLLQACEDETRPADGNPASASAAPADDGSEAALKRIWTQDHGDLSRAAEVIARAFDELVGHSDAVD